MFLKKIKTGQSGILTYGITPPKSGTSKERAAETGRKTIERIRSLDIDALIVYDVQDESARTSVERPFPFLQAQDPFEFASQHLLELKIPKIIYRPAGKYSPAELSDWLQNLQQHMCYPVFVGVPTPDYPVKTSLPKAYEIWNQYQETSVIGAITIPERHEMLKNEDKRMIEKVSCGVSYFISQCVFNVAYAKRLIKDLERSCKASHTTFPTVVFTLTVCGSEKTLEFMEWLGIHIPENLKEEFRNAGNMLQRSVDESLQMAAELAALCASRSLPFGFNIESVATKASEVDASIYLVNKVGKMLNQYGVRSKTALTDNRDHNLASVASVNGVYKY